MRVLMTGGGTGGHIYPAIAIADEIKKRNPEAEILFIGNKASIESKVVPEKGYAFRTVPSRWLNRGRGFIKTLIEIIKAGFTTLAGIFASCKIIRNFKPDMTIGTGGFVGVPVILASKLCGVKAYLHEQNAVPGLANKMTGKFCRKVFLGFPGAEAFFNKKVKTVVTGNPVRAEFLKADKAKSREKLSIGKEVFTVFMFGGSLGSKIINETAYRYMQEIEGKEDRFLILGSGERFIQNINEKAEKPE
jgi:UDP-N-acetylglucosamine--N-acetylmuramyl-(pentapeptide) pyrophosphoryl-undecaprenol N-acetylglucosamine transferase